MQHSTTVSEMDEEIENLSFGSHTSVGLGYTAAATVDAIAFARYDRTEGGNDAHSDVDSEESFIQDESVQSIVKRFIVTGFPLTFSTLAQFSLNTVVIAVVGQMLGDEELGGASLALGLINATGFAFGAGLCGALETVLSHCYGTHKRNLQKMRDYRTRYLAKHPNADFPEVEEQPLYMYGIYAQRMMIILLVVAFPLGLILAFTDSIMNALGGNPLAVHFTGQWCRVALYAIPATLYYQLIQRYYSCQHVTIPLSVAMVSAALLNPVMQFVFIKLFGFYGSPVAWSLLMYMICFGLTGYLAFTGRYKKTWGGWSKKGTQNIGSLLAIALPSMGMMMSEWVALEINALAGGFAETIPLAAYSITLQVFGIMWGIGSGVMILGCVFVGNAIGSGNPLLGRKIAFVAVGLILCIALFDVVVVWALSPFIPRWFSTNEEVVATYKKLMYVVMPYHIIDTFQSTVMGILRGCGLQKLGAVIICTAFCVVGIPTSFTLFFYFDHGVISLWIGPMMGVLIVGVPSYIYILLFHIDWANLKPVEEELPDDGTVQSPSGSPIAPSRPPFPTSGAKGPSSLAVEKQGKDADNEINSEDELLPP